MREKGGLHMEKREHMDPQRCDRIWQRVSPELMSLRMSCSPSGVDTR